MSTLTVNKFVSLRRSLEKFCKFDNKERDLHLELHSRTQSQPWSTAEGGKINALLMVKDCFLHSLVCLSSRSISGWRRFYSFSPSSNCYSWAICWMCVSPTALRHFAKISKAHLHLRKQSLGTSCKTCARKQLTRGIGDKPYIEMNPFWLAK